MSNQEPEAKDHPLSEKALKELFAQSHDRGRAGLPVMSLSMGRGLTRRNQDERRVETNLSDEQHRLVRAGELAYNMMRMWQGVCGLAEEDCLISPAYVVVRPLDGMDPKFSEYLLTYEETVAQFKRRSFGVVDDRLRLYYKDFERVRVKVPFPESQRKIAKILATLDTLIEKTEAVIAKYQAVKQGLMHDIFTRGVDENRHLRPSHSEASDLYRPSPLGPIPRGWDFKSIGELCLIRSGGTPLRDMYHRYFQDGQIPWVKTMDLTENEIWYTDERITTLALSESACTLFPPTTVLIAMYGGFMQIGRTGILSLEAATNQAICGLTSKSEKLIHRFLLRYLQFSRYRWRSVATSTRKDPNITKHDVANFLVALPSVTEQTSIIGAVEKAESFIDVETRRLAKLRETRSGLIQAFLTGKVRVQVDPAEGAFDA